MKNVISSLMRVISPFFLMLLLLVNYTSHAEQDWDWQTSSNWAYKIYDKYMIRNNIWGATAWTGEGVGDQTIFANSESHWKIVATHTNGTGNAQGMVKAYPQVVRGWVQGGISGSSYVTDNHALAIKIDDLTKAELYADIDMPESGRYMVLWDTYYFYDEVPGLPYESNKPDFAVMIFQHIWDDHNWMYTDGNTNPEITLGGQDWRYKVSTTSSLVKPGGKVVVLFPQPYHQPQMLINLKAILQELRDLGHIDGQARVSSIQMGVEIIDGGTYTINNFWTAFQDEPSGVTSTHTEDKTMLEDKIFVNPVKGGARIQLASGTSAAIVVLYDLMGRKISQKSVSPYQRDIVLTASTTGVYVVNAIFKSGDSYTRKVLITH